MGSGREVQWPSRPLACPAQCSLQKKLYPTLASSGTQEDTRQTEVTLLLHRSGWGSSASSWQVKPQGRCRCTSSSPCLPPAGQLQSLLPSLPPPSQGRVSWPGACCHLLPPSPSPLPASAPPSPCAPAKEIKTDDKLPQLLG